MDALISQHPTRVLLLFLTNLYHNRQPNLSKCTPINLMRALPTQSKLRPPLLTLYWQWSIDPLTPLMMMLQRSAMSFQLRGLIRLKTVNWQWSIDPLTPLTMMLQTSAMSFQLRGLLRFKSVNASFFSMPITPINNW